MSFNGTYFVIMVRLGECCLYLAKDGLTVDKYRARTWKTLSGAEKAFENCGHANKFISER